MDIQLIGYDVLGPDGSEGIRYAWQHKVSPYYVESAAFVQHSKGTKDNICGYTTSVSGGCVLKDMNLSCKFCRTGTQLPFGAYLTAIEIAKQNVFMVLCDMNCSDYPDLRSNQREFAYMGQGDPGFSYNQVREAIQITNIVMEKLDQIVFRHIIATSGVPQMIKLYTNDVRQKIFSSRTTMHFSLHGTKNRSQIMPINNRFSYKECLEELYKIAPITGEKPCIGILLLKNFVPLNSDKPYTTDFDAIEEILAELDPKLIRLSFCEFNGSPDLGTYDPYDEDMSAKILNYAKTKGFEAKLFSSFGKKEVTACGMLGGKAPQNIPSNKWTLLEQEAERLVLSATDLLSF